jgi:hypothetical protein
VLASPIGAGLLQGPSPYWRSLYLPRWCLSAEAGQSLHRQAPAEAFRAFPSLTAFGFLSPSCYRPTTFDWPAETVAFLTGHHRKAVATLVDPNDLARVVTQTSRTMQRNGRGHSL